jgi:hypothetical protein
MSTYDHLKSKGIDLIRNDSLRRNITAVYSERYYYIEKMELEYDNRYQLNTVVPMLNEKLIIDDVLKLGYPNNLQNLYLDTTFKGVLRMNIKIRKFMLERYSGISKDLKGLIEHINSELIRRK